MMGPCSRCPKRCLRVARPSAALVRNTTPQACIGRRSRCPATCPPHLQDRLSLPSEPAGHRARETLAGAERLGCSKGLVARTGAPFLAQAQPGPSWPKLAKASRHGTRPKPRARETCQGKAPGKFVPGSWPEKLARKVGHKSWARKVGPAPI